MGIEDRGQGWGDPSCPRKSSITQMRVSHVSWHARGRGVRTPCTEALEGLTCALYVECSHCAGYMSVCTTLGAGDHVGKCVCVILGVWLWLCSYACVSWCIYVTVLACSRYVTVFDCVWLCVFMSLCVCETLCVRGLSVWSDWNCVSPSCTTLHHL